MQFLLANYKNIVKQIIFIIFLLAIVLLPYFVFAAVSSPAERLREFGSGTFRHSDDPQSQIASTVGLVINAFLSLLGIIFIILIIISGAKYMMSGGNEAKAKEATDAIRRAIIGLIITVGAFAIWNFVSSYLIG